MKQWTEIFRQLSLLTQLGISLVTPLLICLAVCYLLTSKAGAGGWIYLPGFLFGLGGGVSTALKFSRFMDKEARRDSKSNLPVRRKHEKGTSFNEHF